MQHRNRGSRAAPASKPQVLHHGCFMVEVTCHIWKTQGIREKNALHICQSPVSKGQVSSPSRLAKSSLTCPFSSLHSFVCMYTSVFLCVHLCVGAYFRTPSLHSYITFILINSYITWRPCKSFSISEFM